MIVTLSWIISLLILACIYPHHFILLDRLYLESPDAGIPYVHTFALVNQFFHGGLQLFDRYDQFSYVYGHMSAGVYAIDNVVTAFFYIICSPFLPDQAQGYHQVFSLVFYGFTSLIRAIGGYLLLGLFIKNRVVILISLVYLNTFLSTITMIEGHISHTSFSFLPFMAFFLLRFFHSWRLNDALAAILLMGVTVSNQPLFGLGYYYVMIHFLIIVCLVRALCDPDIRRRVPRFRWPSGSALLKCGGVAVMVGLMLLPTAMMLGQLNTDFYIADSGLGQTSGRLSNAFKPLNYFKDVHLKSCANPLEFFFRSLDFEHYVWGGAHWIFLGVGVLVFSLFGWILARDSRKHIFGWTMVVLILLNVAPYLNNWFVLFDYLRQVVTHPALAFKQGLHLEQLPLMALISASGIVHWIDALTNPFCFLLRSFHVVGVFMPYLSLPLIALGISACVDLVQGEHGRIYRQRVPWLMGLLVGALIACACFFEGKIRLYSMGGILCFLMFLVATYHGAYQHRWQAWRAWGFLVLVIVIDVVALNMYVQHYPNNIKVIPRAFEGLAKGQEVMIEYQNPKTMAFREYLRPEFLGASVSCIENYYGLFFQFVPMQRNFIPSDIYTPIPTAYRDLHQDGWMKVYLNQERRVIDFRDLGVPESDVSMKDLLASHVADRLVVVNDRQASHLTNIQEVRLGPRVPVENWRQFSFNASAAQVRHVGREVELGIKLPPDFPKYIATSVFTKDMLSWHMTLGEIKLTPVQGYLKDPYTFDVHNIRVGWLMVRLPGGLDLKGKTFHLRVKMPDYVTAVWQNEHDHLGITFSAPHDGWMIIHYPYDTKWHLTVDGKPMSLYRVNQYFMGAPMSAGSHQVLLTYWPGTPLRWLLILSMILVVVVFEGLIIYAFRQKRLE